jgi:hypothetical protein
VHTPEEVREHRERFGCGGRPIVFRTGRRTGKESLTSYKSEFYAF